MVFSGMACVSDVLMLVSDPSGAEPPPASGARRLTLRGCWQEHPFEGLRCAYHRRRACRAATGTTSARSKHRARRGDARSARPRRRPGASRRDRRQPGVRRHDRPRRRRHPPQRHGPPGRRGDDRAHPRCRLAARPEHARAGGGDARRLAPGRPHPSRRDRGRARPVGLGPGVHDRLGHLLLERRVPAGLARGDRLHGRAHECCQRRERERLRCRAHRRSPRLRSRARRPARRRSAGRSWARRAVAPRARARA